MATDTNTTRRNLIASMAALPMVSLSALAGTDPVFKALERRETAVNAANHSTENLDEHNPLYREMIESEEVLPNVTPTTAAGAIALASFLQNYLKEIYMLDEEIHHDGHVILGTLNNLENYLKTQQIQGGTIG